MPKNTRKSKPSKGGATKAKAAKGRPTRSSSRSNKGSKIEAKGEATKAKIARGRPTRSSSRTKGSNIEAKAAHQPVASSEVYAPLSYDEQLALSEAMNRVPERFLPEVMEFLKSRTRNQGTERIEEIDIEIDELDAKSQRELFQMVMEVRAYELKIAVTLLLV